MNGIVGGGAFAFVEQFFPLSFISVRFHCSA